MKIGAFATDMLMSPLPSEMVAQVTKVHAQRIAGEELGVTGP